MVGAFSHFTALQQQKAQRRVVDISTWTRCFTLYITVLSKKAPNMVLSIVTHLHTVLYAYNRRLLITWLGWSMISSLEWNWRPQQTEHGQVVTRGSICHACQAHSLSQTFSKFQSWKGSCWEKEKGSAQQVQIKRQEREDKSADEEDQNDDAQAAELLTSHRWASCPNPRYTQGHGGPLSQSTLSRPCT